MRLLEIDSPLQRIELYDELGAGLVLVLDGMVQFRQAEEHRYHECLAVVPMLFGRPRRVFIGGGGDGLAAARLLRFEEVEAITVCDYDPAITELCRSQPALARANAHALEDPRVRVVNADAFAYLRDTEGEYDLVIGDFPDPFYSALGRLYSRAFYEVVGRRLAPGGLLVTQTLAVPECARMIQATIEQVLPHRRFYKFGPHGFTLASGEPLVKRREVPEWTRFLTDAFVERLFVLSKEETAQFDPTGAALVEEGDDALVKEAILHVYGRLMAYPFEDRPQTLLVELGPALVGRLNDRTALLLEALDEQGELCLLVERDTPEAARAAASALGYAPTGGRVTQAVGPVTEALTERARGLWAAENTGELVRLEPLTELAGDDDDVAALFGRAAPSPALRAVGARLDPERPGLLLAARGRDGATLALWRLGHALDGVGLECLWAPEDGPHRRLSLLLSLLYLARVRYEGYTLRSPVAEDASLLVRLGPVELRTFDVWAK